MKMTSIAVGVLLITTCFADNTTAPGMSNTVNVYIAWSIAGVGILLAVIFLTLFLCIKIRYMSCYGCQGCIKKSFRMNGVDIASIYRHTSSSRDSEHSYARIEDTTYKSTEREDCPNSPSCQTRIPSVRNGQQSPDVGFNWEYLMPQASENVTDDYRISRLSELLKTSFWSQENIGDSEEHLNNCQKPPRQTHNRTRRCRDDYLEESKSDERKWRSTERKHRRRGRAYTGSAAAGHFIPDTENDPEQHGNEGRNQSSRPPVTDSMVDVFQELLNPANKAFRGDLLRQLRLNSVLDDSRSRRISRSDTDLSLSHTLEKYGGGDDDIMQSASQDDEDHYTDVKKKTPTPKRRKSLTRIHHLENATQLTGHCRDSPETNPRASVKSNTIQCTYQQDKPRPPVPLPRSKSLNRGQIPSQGILKTSETRWTQEYDNALNDLDAQCTLMSEFSLPHRNLRDSLYRNQVQDGDSSLKRTAQKVKKATYLDGRAAPGKEYLNVRMVVKNLSCSVEDMGLDSDFWNT